ncbi:MAG: hypothetical protein ACXVHQ_40625 [Solirubrobacteraceae bacterium]
MCEAQGVERTACVTSDPRSAVEACPIDAIAPEDQIAPEWEDCIDRKAAKYSGEQT